MVKDMMFLQSSTKTSIMIYCARLDSFMNQFLLVLEGNLQPQPLGHEGNKRLQQLVHDGNK